MIVVFGSNVLDFFFHTSDLPEDDQAIFLDTHDEAPGGKGANQAVAAARAGSQVYFSGALGKGGHARQMYDNLIENDVDTSGIRFLKDAPSGLASVFVNDQTGKHKILVSHGANLKARQDWIPDHLLNSGSTVLVQGELPILETEKLLERTKKFGGRTIMNFAPASQNLSDNALRNIDYLVMNEHEANSVAKQQNLDSTDKSVFAKTLFDKFNVITIITLGEDGAICASSEGLLKIPALKIKPVDTVGAGDAFVGYLATNLDKGNSLNNSLRAAVIAGALACTKTGAQAAVPFAKDVSAHLDELELISA